MSRVLVVEDDPLIAMMLADWLGELDHVVVGPAMTADQALALLDPAPDAAVLDVTLGAGDSCSVAAVLQDRGIPFAFASGHGNAGLPAGFTGVPMLAKPFDFDSIEHTLRALLSGRS